MQQLSLPSFAFPHRAPLRYFGGKWRMASWLIRHFTCHLHYCTPYGGGWCESFQKTRSRGREVYNDLNAHNVNFFRQLRDNPEQLISLIEATPRNRIEFEECRKPVSDPVEAAKRYYLYCTLSFMAGGGPLWSGTSDARLALRSVSDDSHLWAASQRLQSVLIEQLDALECIVKYDSPQTLFYCDPGYPKESLASGDRTWYLHHTDTDGHRGLAELLHRIQGNAVVSGYDCPLYQELFAGWRRIDRQVLTMTRTNAIESIWIKPSGGASHPYPASFDRIELL